MERPTVRLALDCDGEAVRALVEAQSGVSQELGWSHIAPYWLVAEIGGRIVGALQTCPSRPVGRLEMLCTAKDLSRRQKVEVIKGLAYAGMGCIQAHGAQQVQMFIPEALESYRAVLMGRGAEVLDTGHMLAKRLV